MQMLELVQLKDTLDEEDHNEKPLLHEIKDNNSCVRMCNEEYDSSEDESITASLQNA